MLSFHYFAIAGIALVLIGIWAIAGQRHLLRKVLGFNIASSGVYLLLAALANRTAPTELAQPPVTELLNMPLQLPDPVPHAMVITGLVVSVSATALLLAFILRLKHQTGHCELPGKAKS